MMGFIKKLTEILNKKRAELDTMTKNDRVGEIEYSILNEEIEDIKYILNATSSDYEDFLSAVYKIKFSTTSNSVYDTIQEFEDKLKLATV